MLEEEFFEYEEIKAKVLSLPSKLFTCLTYRVGGMPPPKIAQKMAIAELTVKKYNEQLINVFNIEKLSKTERDFYFFVTVRPVVQHIQQNPYYMSVIDANPELAEPDNLISFTGPTWKLPKFIGTDPNDTKHIYNFTLFIVIFVLVLIIIVITLLAVALGAFTLSPTPFIYIGI